MFGGGCGKKIVLLTTEADLLIIIVIKIFEYTINSRPGYFRFLVWVFFSECLEYFGLA